MSNDLIVGGLSDGEVVRIESGKTALRRKGDAGEPREVILSLKAQ